jgi:hypothetical protein
MTRERVQEIAAGFDLRALPPDFYANPYPVYSLLREIEPVKRMPDGSWFLPARAVRNLIRTAGREGREKDRSCRVSSRT